MNEALHRIDAVLNNAALDKDLSTPPASPTEGDTYIVAASPTGAWAGKASQLAYYQQIWRFIVPQAGIKIWVADEAAFYVFNGTAWVIFSAANNSFANVAVSGQSTVVADNVSDTLTLAAGSNITLTTNASTDTVTISATSGTSLATAGFRNLLLNGHFEFWQRGTSFTDVATKYGPDRWLMYRGTGNVTVSQQTASVPTGFRRCARVQRNSGDTAVGGIVLEQNIETRNSVRMQGRSMTLSFWARAGANFSASGLTAAVSSGTGTDQAAIGSGFTGLVTLGSSAFTLTSSWQRFTLTVTAGSNITQLMTRFTFVPTGTAGANDWYEITGVQLEDGSAATDFEFTDYATDLVRCQRYYEKSFLPDTAPVQNSGDTANASRFPQIVAASSNMHYALHFVVEKRVAPTVVFFNPSAANAQVRNSSSGTDCSGSTASIIGTKGFGPFCTTPASTSIAQRLLVHFTADAEIY